MKPEYSLEGTDAKTEIPLLWPPDAKSWLIGKDPDAGKDWGQEEKGMTEAEMVGWHHRHNGHGFGWTLGVGDGQGGLPCCGSWDHRVGHDWATELNWTEQRLIIYQSITSEAQEQKIPFCRRFKTPFYHKRSMNIKGENFKSRDTFRRRKKPYITR